MFFLPLLHSLYAARAVVVCESFAAQKWIQGNRERTFWFQVLVWRAKRESVLSSGCSGDVDVCGVVLIVTTPAPVLRSHYPPKNTCMEHCLCEYVHVRCVSGSSLVLPMDQPVKCWACFSKHSSMVWSNSWLSVYLFEALSLFYLSHGR